MLRRLVLAANLAFVIVPMALSNTASASFNSGAPNAGAPNVGVPNSEVVSDYSNSLYHFTVAPALERFSRIPSHAVGSPQQTPNEVSEADTCGSFYSKFTSKGLVRMHASFGYFDDSRGEEMVFNGVNFGNNAAMDHAYLLMLRRALTSSCSGEMQLCDFREVATNIFRKSVRNPQTGQAVTFEIKTDDSALTPYYLTNTQERADEQQAKSEATRQAFMDAVQSDDAVFYFGHSRNGGGPDFLPVKILGNGHPNYHGYYMIQHPGFKDLMSAVRSRGEAPPVLGLFSCYSEFWFGRTLSKASPNSGFIFTQSDKLSGMDEHFVNGLAAIDSLLRFQCYDGMQAEMEAARKDDSTHELIRNFLTHRSPVNPNPHISSVPD